MVFIEMTLIALATVFVIDISGFTEAWTSSVSRILTHGKKDEPFEFKPFTCSLCSSLWLNLIWILATGQVTFYTVAFCFLMAYMAPTFHDVLINIQDFMSFLNAKINGIFRKKE